MGRLDAHVRPVRTGRLQPAVLALSALLVACAAAHRQPAASPMTAAAPRVLKDVIYGHKLGMALTLDVIA